MPIYRFEKLIKYLSSYGKVYEIRLGANRFGALRRGKEVLFFTDLRMSHYSALNPLFMEAYILENSAIVPETAYKYVGSRATGKLKLLKDPDSENSWYVLEFDGDNRFRNIKRLSGNPLFLALFGTRSQGFLLEDIVEHKMYEELLDNYGIKHAKHRVFARITGIAEELSSNYLKVLEELKLGKFRPLFLLYQVGYGKRKEVFLAERRIAARITANLHLPVLETFYAKYGEKFFKELAQNFRDAYEDLQRREIHLRKDLLHHRVIAELVDAYRGLDIEARVVDVEEAELEVVTDKRLIVPKFKLPRSCLELEYSFERKRLLPYLKFLVRHYSDSEYTQELIENLSAEPRQYWVKYKSNFVELRFEKPILTSRWIEVKPL